LAFDMAQLRIGCRGGYPSLEKRRAKMLDHELAIASGEACGDGLGQVLVIL
jgi:hypothetical protein